MNLETCPFCHIRVVLAADGSCPSCRRPMQSVSAEGEAGAESIMSATVNPYQSPTSEPSEEVPADQTKLIARGGRIFLAILGINISPMIWAILTNQPMENPGLGTFLSLALLYFLWRGQPWAKWTTVVLFAPTSVLLLIAGIASGELLFIAFGGLIAFVPITLLFSKSLNAFLLNQRWSVA
jgi:hypothetical protein